MIDPKYLLTDEQMRDYITRGYLVLKTGLPKSAHDRIYQRTTEVFDSEGNPGNNILPRVPELNQVFADPTLRGALTSVLGPDHIMHSHRHCHVNRGPGEGGGVHRDSYWGYQRMRNHRTRWAMLFYYPQDCPEEIGPTGVVPGSHTYASKESWEPLEDILPCVGEAGTAVLVHFDIWHRACPNLLEKTRFMMKFQFTRMSEPTTPTWNNRSPRWPGGNGSGDRHSGMWQKMWNWHRGEPFADVGAAAVSEADALSQLTSEDLPRRMEAVGALGRPEASDRALSALDQALRDTAEPVRLNAAYALAAAGDVDRLVACLDDSFEPSRQDAAYGLAASGPGANGPAAEPALVAACGDAAESRRAHAAFALGEMGAHVGTAAAAAVAALVTDESESVRRNAADALSTMTAHADHAVPALTRLMADDSGQVRFDAAYGLARHGGAAAPATEALIAALQDDNRYVRNHSAAALRSIGTPQATAALVDFLELSRWCPITTKDSTF